MCPPAGSGSGSYDALLAGSYEQYVRNSRHPPSPLCLLADGGSAGYDALLAGSYEQYVRNQQAAPEWEAEQMEQVRSIIRCGCGCLSCEFESNQAAPEGRPSKWSRWPQGHMQMVCVA